MFTTLLASDRKSKRGAMTPATLILSSAFHGLLLVGVVYASVRPPEESREPDELVTFMDVPDVPDQPEPPPPPPPEAAAPPPPIGAPALIPPIDPPAFIPPPDPGQLKVNVEHYSGDIPILDAPVTTLPGGEGATDAFPTERNDSTVYKVDVLDSPPDIINRAAFESIMRGEYPKVLANAGIEGDVVAEFVVQPDGTIDMSTVKIVSASHERFEDATRNLLGRLRFRPGRFRGEPVRVLTSVPVQWRVGGR